MEGCGGYGDRGRGKNGGRGGIRTRGGNYPTFDFESSALNRTQPPFLNES